jgi:hypothetical protein
LVAARRWLGRSAAVDSGWPKRRARRTGGLLWDRSRVSAMSTTSLVVEPTIRARGQRATNVHHVIAGAPLPAPRGARTPAAEPQPLRARRAP